MSESITLEIIYKEVRNIREMLEELAEKTVKDRLSYQGENKHRGGGFERFIRRLASLFGSQAQMYLTM